MSTQHTGIRNSFIAGFIPGLIVPVLAIILFWWIKLSEFYYLIDWLQLAMRRGFESEVLALGAVANLALFFLFIQIKWYWSARAVVFATFFYALAMAIFLFI